jgi:hypothetical protein
MLFKSLITFWAIFFYSFECTKIEDAYYEPLSLPYPSFYVGSWNVKKNLTISS